MNVPVHTGQMEELQRKYLPFKRNTITKMRIEIHVHIYCFKLYNVHIVRRFDLRQGKKEK